MLNPVLAWVDQLQSSLDSAGLHSRDIEYPDHADPLKKLAVLILSEPLKSGDFQAVRELGAAFAKANNCVLERIRLSKDRRSMTLEILIKRRLGKHSARNPLRDPNPGDKPRPEDYHATDRGNR